jgi:3-isopropylmalate/(R)-2-methylmalate dehydratase small subunit
MKAKNFSGKVLFLDRSDINTDEIIPARYLTGISKEGLKPYLFEDIQLEGFDPARDIAGKSVIIARANFAYGSSREHAVWALEVNEINLVIAQSFARIFKQNMFNCGMMAVELPEKTIHQIFNDFCSDHTRIETDLEASEFLLKAGGSVKRIPFSISDFHRTLIETKGWVEYADLNY